MKHALMVIGGWPGHTPEKSADMFQPALEEAGFNVRRESTLDVYLDRDLLSSLDLIVPIWTQGGISKKQLEGLQTAKINFLMTLRIFSTCARFKESFGIHFRTFRPESI